MQQSAAFSDPYGLRAENDELRERLRQMDDALGGHFVAPSVFRLTPTENRVLGVLMSRDTARRSALTLILYGEKLREPERNNLNVVISHIRKKVAPFGVQISTVWNEGWYLPVESKASIKRLMADG